MIALSQITGAVDAEVDRFLTKCHVLAPPVDAFRVAESLGLTIVRNNRQAGRASLVQSDQRRSRGSPSILLKEDPRRERNHWSVAHEIGEHLAAQIASAAGVEIDHLTTGMREQLANVLAGRLLVPTGWLAEHARSTDGDLFQLKQLFSTASHELIARRMLDLSAPIVITIFDQGRMTFRQSNSGNARPPLALIERAAQQAAYETGNVAQLNRGLRVSAWPIHEPQWKREILRLELPAEGCEFYEADAG